VLISDRGRTMQAAGASRSVAALACWTWLCGAPVARADDAPAAAATGATTANAPPSAGRRGWLPELADRCWLRQDFGVAACYWQRAPDDIRFLRRNAEGLLGCGAIAPHPDTGLGVRVRTRDPEARDPDATWWWTSEGICQTTSPPRYPEGGARTTMMTRPHDGRMAVRRAGV